MFYRFLLSTTKWDMGQPPSFQALKCSDTELEETSMKRGFSGSLGFCPLVRVFNMSEASPAPMLKYMCYYTSLKKGILLTLTC